MAIIKKPYKGGSFNPSKSSQVWSQVIDTVNAVQSGRFNNAYTDQSQVEVKAEGHREIEAGELVSLKRTISDGSENGSRSTIIIETEDVRWHDNLANVSLVATDVKAAGALFSHATNAWSFAKLRDMSDTSGERGVFGGGSMKLWAMPSADNPGLLQPAHSGIYEIVAYSGLGAQLAVVNIYKSQPYWRYRLDEAFGDTEEKKARAKLIDIAGSEFEDGSTTTITDLLGLMDDQSAGDEGICLHAGNDFHAIQATC